MQITRRADYAVRTMLDVARVQPGAMALTHEVAARQGIPTPFLAKIVLSLTRGGLLKSFRGSGGGIVLAKSAEEISLLRIVEAVDGPIAMNRCVLWPEECSRSPLCPVHQIWCETREALAERLDGTSLAAMVRKAESLEAAAPAADTAVGSSS